MDRIILIIVLLGLVVLSTEGLWLGRQKKVRQENEHVQEKIAVGSRNARSAQDCLNDVNEHTTDDFSRRFLMAISLNTLLY